MKKNVKSRKEQAKKSLERIRKLTAQNPTPIFRMSEDGVIKALRKTREELWEKKLASRS